MLFQSHTPDTTTALLAAVNDFPAVQWFKCSPIQWRESIGNSTSEIPTMETNSKEIFWLQLTKINQTGQGLLKSIKIKSG